MLQGALRDRWLLGAIACVGCRPDLLLDLFVSDELADKGLYTFQFYKHGCWHQVVIDSYLPCVLGHEEVLFACSGTPGVIVGPDAPQRPRVPCAAAVQSSVAPGVHHPVSDCTSPYEVCLSVLRR